MYARFLWTERSMEDSTHQQKSTQQKPKQNLKQKQKQANGTGTTSSMWILALRIHHAIQSDGALPSEGPSLLDELREVGASKTEALCGIRPEAKPRHSWVIPTRGTPEYEAVSAIKHCLKSHAALETMSRELLQLQEQNKAWTLELDRASA